MEALRLVPDDEHERGAFLPALDAFGVADASDLPRFSLNRRYDIKCVLSLSALPDLLAHLRRASELVLAGGSRVAHYETLYLDTPELDCYRRHHGGRTPRVKVRIREHRERRLAFLEVKIKEPSGLTRKVRRERPLGFHALDDLERAFATAAFRQNLNRARMLACSLAPVLRVSFSRVTLVHPASSERSTIDFGLVFETRAHRVTLPDLVVLEVKAASASAPLLAQARRLAKTTGGGLSKYCMGMALLSPDLPRHRFHRRLRRIESFSSLCVEPAHSSTTGTATRWACHG